MVGKGVDSVKQYFGIQNWPSDTGQLDLGGRVIDIIPTPGHDSREITHFDKWTGFLLTGDLIYPGRLYVENFQLYRESLQKLMVFAESHCVRYLMEAHIEMKREPGMDYPMTSIYQPDEPPLQMTCGVLSEVVVAFEKTGGKPGVFRSGSFVIFNGPCYFATIKQTILARVQNFRHRHKRS